jgi:hypothetical protein
MREITMPDIRLPEGLREMSRDDIVQAARDVGLAARDIGLPNVSLPSKIEVPDIDVSKVELPKSLADRLPRRRRMNPILPIAGVLAVGAMIAAAWWLFTSSLTGPRVRSAIGEIKQRVTGERTDVVRYDNEENLGSLLTDAGKGRAAMDSDPYTSTADLSDTTHGVPVGPGIQPEGVGVTAR